MFETLYPICSELCELQILFMNLRHVEKSLTMNSSMPEEMNLLPEKCVIFSSLNIMSRVGKVGFSVGKFCISLKLECAICWKLPPEVLEKQHLFGCHLLGHHVYVICSIACMFLPRQHTQKHLLDKCTCCSPHSSCHTFCLSAGVWSSPVQLHLRHA